jgi:hypothetical protein
LETNRKEELVQHVGEVVSQIMTGFHKQARRKLFFGVSCPIQVILVEKVNNNFQFTSTDILTICPKNLTTWRRFDNSGTTDVGNP